MKVPPLFNLLMLLLAVATAMAPRQAIAAQSSSGGGGLLEATKSLLGGGEADDGSSWITEKIGEYLPLDLPFVDEEGREVGLGDIIDRPTLFLPIYYYCPNICSKNLANLAVALGGLRSRPGIDYRVVALSFSEVESFKDAADAKRNYIKILPENWPAEQWRFLTGKADAIKAATDAVGFRFQKIDDETFIHPAALMVIARDGKIIRYVYGSFLSGDIDLALASAAEGVPMMSVKRLLSFCFNYDPHGKTSIFEMVKIIVLVIFAMALAAVFLYYRRKGRPRGTAGSDNIQP